jgi:D-methionine transport system substrate-binding protein
MKKILNFGLIGLLALFLAACGNDTSGTLAEDKILVGATGGPHEQVMEKVKELAADEGIEVEIKTFNDYNTPNSALDEGSLDASSYQTLSFLEDQKENKGYELTEVFKTLTFPMGIYSEKIADISELKEGDKIAVPNDPANEYRALKLFEQAGVLKVDPEANNTATAKDVVENPLNLEIVELDAAQLPAQLEEVQAATINTNFAMGAGLTIKDDAIFAEDTENNPWSNYFVVRTANKDDAIVGKLKDIYQSDEMKQFVEDEFNGSVVPSW